MACANLEAQGLFEGSIYCEGPQSQSLAYQSSTLPFSSLEPHNPHSQKHSRHQFLVFQFRSLWSSSASLSPLLRSFGKFFLRVTSQILFRHHLPLHSISTFSRHHPNTPSPQVLLSPSCHLGIFLSSPLLMETHLLTSSWSRSREVPRMSFNPLLSTIPSQQLHDLAVSQRTLVTNTRMLIRQ